MIPRFFITIICSLIPLFLHAKNWTAPSQDSTTAKIGLVTPGMDIFLYGANEETKSQVTSVEYQPTTQTQLKLAVGYGPLMASGSIGTSTITPEIKQKYGETNVSDWQFRIYGERHTFDVYYQKYKGFHIENSKAVDSSWVSEDKIQRSDIETELAGFQYIYSFNPDSLSLGAVFDQYGTQDQSGGGFFLSTGIENHRVSASSSLVPTTLQSEYPQFSSFEDGQFRTLKIGFSGAYTLVFNNFYLAGYLTYFGGQREQRYRLNNEDIHKILPASGSDLRVSTGYNGKSFFLTLVLLQMSANMKIADGELIFSTLEQSLWIGTRF